MSGLGAAVAMQALLLSTPDDYASMLRRDVEVWAWIGTLEIDVALLGLSEHGRGAEFLKTLKRRAEGYSAFVMGWTSALQWVSAMADADQ